MDAARPTDQPVRLPPDATPADVARAVLHLRARGRHAAADWLASHLPPSDPFAHLNAPPQPLPPNGPSPEAEGGEGGVAPAVSPMAAQVPHPPNPEGAGSLPPRFTKAHDGPHKFGCVFLLVPEPLRSRVLRMGRMIPDADLADDGREDDPHATSLFGLHDSDPVPVFEALSHFRPVHVTLGKVSCFAGDEYDVVKIDVESDALHRLNAKLRQLPHTNSYKDFVPHVTIAYVKSGTGKLYAERLGSLDERCVCDTAVFSDADKTRHVYPLGRFASGSVAKAMSYLGGASGGTLVGPAAMGAGKPRRLKRNRRTQRRILKALGEIGGGTSFLTDFNLAGVDAEELAFGEKAFDPAQPRDEVGQWAKLQAGAASRTADLGDVEARLRAAHLARAEELERAADDGERSVEDGLAMGLSEDHPGVALARSHVPLLRRLARERRALAAGRVPHVAKGLEADESAADADDMVAWYTKGFDPDEPRETTAHDGKRPGEWAPAPHGADSSLTRMKANGVDLTDPKAFAREWSAMDPFQQKGVADEVYSAYLDADTPGERAAVRRAVLASIPHARERHAAGEAVGFDDTWHVADSAVLPGESVRVAEPGVEITGHLPGGGGVIRVARARVTAGGSKRPAKKTQRSLFDDDLDESALSPFPTVP